jgi:hypothetical protein
MPTRRRSIIAQSIRTRSEPERVVAGAAYRDLPGDHSPGRVDEAIPNLRNRSRACRASLECG